VVQLFDQENDVADKHPEIAEKIGAYLKSARTPSADWEPHWQKPGKKKAK
jgi:hypothetical protein